MMNNEQILIKLRERDAKVKGRVTMIGTDSKTGEIISKAMSENMVMQGSLTGLDLLIQYLIGNMAPAGSAAAFVGGINYGEIGTGITAVTLQDVAMATPYARVPPTLQQDYGQQEAIFQFFFPDGSLANQTYTEFSTWINGTAALSSGAMFNRVVLASSYIKNSGQDTTAQVAFTFSQ